MQHGPPLLVLATLLPALAGCLAEPGSDDTGYRARPFSVEQMGEASEGVATLRLRAHAPAMMRADVLVTVDGERREDATDATGCPPPEGAWAWCGQGGLRAGERLQVRADKGAILRIVDAEADTVLMTLAIR